ncbi:MAG: hypothetical protein GY761_11705 [Hyphomicrobiales bacterium]|nr:hypothetical protein [Hyphomicrobiales bacterium]
MREVDYALVCYVPFADCIDTHFDNTSHTTYCLFKGNASC